MHGPSVFDCFLEMLQQSRSYLHGPPRPLCVGFKGINGAPVEREERTYESRSITLKNLKWQLL